MPQVTLIYTDEHGLEARAVVRTPRFRIGRAPDNDLVVADTNLSRHHAQIELVGDAAFVSDLGSQNGTAVNGERITSSVELRDGDALTLAGARRFSVKIDQAPAASFESTFASASPPRSTSETRASGAPPNAPNASSYATPGAASFVGGATQPTSGPAQTSSGAPQPSSGGRPAWLNPIIIAPVAAVLLLLLVVGGALLAFKHSRGPSSDAGDVDPLESVGTRGDASKRGDAGTKNAGDAASGRQTADARAATSGDAASGASDATNGAGVMATPIASSPASSSSSDAGDLSRDIKRVMSRISNDSAPYISDQGIKDVTAKVREYRGSSALRDRLRAAQRECPDVSALAQKSSLNPTLLMYASIAESESGAGDPASVARQMTPKLTLLSATFGTATANSSLLLIAAYPYPFDPAVGTQQRNPHPLATKLVQYGGSRDVTDPAIARTVWYLREKNAVSPEAYDLVVRLLAVGVVAENPARFGVDSPPLLC